MHVAGKEELSENVPGTEEEEIEISAGFDISVISRIVCAVVKDVHAAGMNTAAVTITLFFSGAGDPPFPITLQGNFPGQMTCTV